MNEGEGEGKGTDRGRREVVKTGAAVALGAVVTGRFGNPRPTFAAGTDELRVGLIGCGGRGTGAAAQAIQAALGVRLVAMADAFPDRLASSHLTLKANLPIAQRVDVPPDRRFVGLDAYSKLLAIGEINYVIIASPPGFKAEQIKAAVEAGKHVFTEKPMAVDGPTIRTCLAMAELATSKGLGVGVGLQRRHHQGYIETMKWVHGGALGELLGGRCYWNQGALWKKPREKTWSDLEYQMRNWLYYSWLSGDHIVEQHIHNIDVIGWGFRQHPVAAVAMGGRQQRTAEIFGNIYDHFAVDFEYPGDVHVLSMCRQQVGCHNDISEHILGTRGRADMNNLKFSVRSDNRSSYTYDAARPGHVNPYRQEQIDLIQSIRGGRPLNELKSATESNLAAVMGRMAAYTGKRVTWEQALTSVESLLPQPLSFNEAVKARPVAVPGMTETI